MRILSPVPVGILADIEKNKLFHVGPLQMRYHKLIHNQDKGGTLQERTATSPVAEEQFNASHYYDNRETTKIESETETLICKLVQLGASTQSACAIKNFCYILAGRTKIFT